MSLSGWCTAAPGARVPHEQCRGVVCGCDCHANPALLRGSERVGTVESGANTSGPGRCANTKDRGLADEWSVD